MFFCIQACQVIFLLEICDTGFPPIIVGFIRFKDYAIGFIFCSAKLAGYIIAKTVMIANQIVYPIASSFAISEFKFFNAI